MRDPFAAEDETSVYVPRPAAERALAQAELAVADGAGIVALIGPPGIGKSILLRVLAKRLERQACCVFPSPEVLTADELYVWIVRELDARETVETERALANRSALLKFREWMRREWKETDTTNAEEALRMRAKDLGSRGFPVVSLIDDADMLAVETLQRFADLARSSDRTIVFGLALTSGGMGDDLLARLGDSAVRVDYNEPLTLAETAAYVPERLRKSFAPPDLLACIDDARIRRIFAYSQGIPRRIHGELSLLHIELTRVRAGVRWPAQRPEEPASATGPEAKRPAAPSARGTVAKRGASSRDERSAPKSRPLAEPDSSAATAAPLPERGEELAVVRSDAPGRDAAVEIAPETPSEVARSAAPRLPETPAERELEPVLPEPAAPDRVLADPIEREPRLEASPAQEAPFESSLGPVLESHPALEDEPAWLLREAVPAPAAPAPTAIALEAAPLEDPRPAAAETVEPEPALAAPAGEDAESDWPAATVPADPEPGFSGAAAAPKSAAPLFGRRRKGRRHSDAFEASPAAPSTEPEEADSAAEETPETEVPEAAPQPLQLQAADRSSAEDPTEQTDATDPARIVIAGPEASDTQLRDAVQTDWTNLSERSVPLAELRLGAESQPEPSAEPSVEPSVAIAAVPVPVAVPTPAQPSPNAVAFRVSTPGGGSPKPLPATPRAKAARGIIEPPAMGWAAAGGTAAAVALAAFFAVAVVALRWRSDPLPPVQSRSPAATAPAASEPTRAPEPVPAPAPAPAPVAEIAAPETRNEPTAAVPSAPALPAKIYRVNINAFPYATIEIDDKVAGETPLGEYPIEAGKHIFRAQMPNGETKERSIDVVQDGMRIVFE